ncbi:MAG: DMT family transporter [Tissierellia bacterium]|nr:DMT family transporter [Tissierellia bacterium]
MNKTKGLTFGILAGFIYGFTPILGKLTYLEGSNPISLTFYRSLLSIPLFFAILKHKKINLKIKKTQSRKLAILALLSSMTALTLYGSYNYISVGMSTTIHYVYPVLVTAACIIIFKEKISRDKLVSLVLSTIGIALFFQGSFNFIGILISFLSGIFFAGYLLYMDKSGLNNNYPFIITFYITIFSSVYLFIFGIISKNLVFNMTYTGWIYTILVAVFVSFFANTFVALAVKYVGPTVTSIVAMLEPITSIVMGMLFLNEAITLRNIVACALILLGVLIVTLSKEKNNSESHLEG